MTKDEALDLALEALENWREFDPENFGEIDNKAITAIKQARSAPVQEPLTGLDIYLDPNDGLKPKRYPAAQRTWIGLKDEQINLFINGRGDEDDDDYVEPTGDGFGITDADLVKLVRRAEAKLKEENGM